VRVTPVSFRSREARPGLSHGIDLRGKRRGGAPKGERVPLDAPPCSAEHGQWMDAPAGAPPPFLGSMILSENRKCTFRDHALGRSFLNLPAKLGRPDAPRERCYSFRSLTYRRLIPFTIPPESAATLLI